jgi:hypothetical protein
MADEFIGYGQAGKPGSWALETFPIATHTSPNGNSINTFTNPAYFTETGFTGTHRDQFEFWAGASTGYAKAAPGSGLNGFGMASPQLGIEYYLNVVQPNAEPGSAGYTTFWTSPIFTVSFPNGNTHDSGFGAGANQYAYGFSVNNYIQVGKIGVTVNPVELYYASRNRNATDLGDGEMRKLRGGLSITVADIAGGYQVTNDLFLGLHHSFSFYNAYGSDFQESREGKIGPALTWSGLVKYGIFISANLNFDYYTTPNLKHSITLTGALVKSF